MKFRNTVTGQIIVASQKFVIQLNTELQLQHGVDAWKIGLWFPCENNGSYLYAASE